MQLAPIKHETVPPVMAREPIDTETCAQLLVGAKTIAWISQPSTAHAARLASARTRVAGSYRQMRAESAKANITATNVPAPSEYKQAMHGRLGSQKEVVRRPALRKGTSTIGLNS